MTQRRRHGTETRMEGRVGEESGAITETHLAAIAQRWGAAGSHLDEAGRRAVVAAMLFQLARPGDRAPRGTWMQPVYEFDPGLQIPLADIALLRTVMQEELVEPLPPPDAIAMQRAVAALVDELIADTTDRRVAALERTALVDPLTQLGNRRAGEEMLRRAHAHASRHGQQLAVAVVDLDGLKRINDEHGHLFGDQALQSMADALRSTLRTDDAAFRFGGDEFVVVAPDATVGALGALFERLASAAPAFSYGIADLGDDVATAEDMVALADSRLYEARRGAAVAPGAVLGRARLALLGGAAGLVAGLLAEAMRRLSGVPIDGAATASWVLFLLAAPVATAVGSASLRTVTPRDALGRAGALGGLALLALIAALTPLLTGDLEEAPRTVASPTPSSVASGAAGAAEPPPEVTTIPTTTTAPPPGPAPSLPEVALPAPQRSTALVPQRPRPVHTTTVRTPASPPTQPVVPDGASTGPTAAPPAEPPTEPLPTATPPADVGGTPAGEPEPDTGPTWEDIVTANVAFGLGDVLDAAGPTGGGGHDGDDTPGNAPPAAPRARPDREDEDCDDDALRRDDGRRRGNPGRKPGKGPSGR